MKNIRIEGAQFRDDQGRTLLLRGVNLGGSSKVPRTPNGATYVRDGFFNHREVSFVGRPFPLDEADEHFSRLRAWGYTFLRFLVTWEAVEHAGPGQYDRDYLEYLHAVVRRAGEHGINLCIDPHQDVWSRFSGGDGAPGWTFEAAGMDITQFGPTGAAIVHAIHGDPLPRMIWPTNSTKLAAATMFTLFFAGNVFAPQARVEGEPVQEFMQRRYCAAMREVAARLRGLPNVIGYGTLNEPFAGFVGWPDLAVNNSPLKIGPSPTPLQSMALGCGAVQEVDTWELTVRGPRRVGRKVIDPGGSRAWLPGRDCVWRTHGVWDLDAAGQPILLLPDYFRSVRGRPVDFAQDYLRPFANRFAAAIRSADPDAAIFLEHEPLRHTPPCWGGQDARPVVYAPHWYDALTLLFKSYSPFLAVDVRDGRLLLGPAAIRRSFAEQIRAFQRGAVEQLSGAPTLIGEFGIPFDLNGKKAFRTSDYRAQVAALDRCLRAMEDSLASCALWNYTADNTNDRGDQWNDEDLSLFSRDQQSNPGDIHSGGRALAAAVRPYVRAVAGEPLRMSFDMRRREFQFEFRHDSAVAAPTEVFVPRYQYPAGCRIAVSDGSFGIDLPEQLLTYCHDASRPVHTIVLRRL